MKLYNQDMPPICDAMRADVDAFRRGVMFAICSIRQATILVPDQLAILFDGAEGESPLFGFKYKAWEYIMGQGGADLWQCLNALPLNKKGARGAILCLLRVPGLGIVKAGFVAQLMGWDVACLDSRNVKREGRNPRAFRSDGLPPAKLTGKVDAYLSETHGKARRYWDAWCRDVAGSYDRSAQEISSLHLSIIPPNFVPF